MSGDSAGNERHKTMYTTQNFKSKKEFKAAVEAWISYDNRLTARDRLDPDIIDAAPRPVTYFQPGPFGGNEPRDGVLYFEGPHFPQSHRWYAQAVAKDGVIVKVK